MPAHPPSDAPLSSPADEPGLLALIRSDWARYFSPDLARNYLGDRSLSFGQKVRVFLDSPGLHASIVYRFGSWTHRTVRSRLVKIPLLLLHYVAQKLVMMCWGIFIHEGARIGPGLYIGHFGGIIIGPIQMGRDCNINHQVTIGVKAGSPGMPTLGDRVWLGVGALVYGDVNIGDGVAIAPYTVVSRSLPPRVMVSGNPMRVVMKDYDNSPAIYGLPAAADATLATVE